MKRCFRCREDKPFDFFCKNKRIKDGYSQQCKSCSKIYHNKNRDSILENNKIYYNKNKDVIQKRQKNYRIENNASIKETQIEYYNNNKESISSQKKKYNEVNKDSIKENKKIYYQNNKDIIKSKHREYKKSKRQDPIFRLKENTRNIITHSIKNKGYTKISKTYEVLGFSFEDFKCYLEKKFEHWMSWDNYGLYNGELNYGWDIDHIIPLSSAKDEVELIRLNHYSNLQPLCSYINRVIKRDKYETSN